MALVVGRNEIGVKRIGRVTTVPDNDVARLMYYLTCVCCAIDCDQDGDIRRFTNYANWALLSTEEQKLLVVLCYTFSPDVFEGKVFFHNEALCIQSSNTFYEINQIRHQLLAVESIIIAGRVHQVAKIMIYKMSWMKTNYLEPMQRLARRFSGQSSQSLSAPVVDNDCCCIIL
jgi:hypothetical protein